MVPATGWKAPELQNDGFPIFSKKAVIGLNKIIATTNASLVLTTSHKSRYSIDSWKRIFEDRGIYAEISKLDDPNNLQTRKDEVLNWLELNQLEKNFVIIDDDKSLNDLPPKFKDTLVLTSPLIGLNEPIADQAIKILQKSS